MPLYGPYEIGTRVTDTALIGVNILASQLYVVVGIFDDGTNIVPAYTDRQDIDGTGMVTGDVYCGPPLSARVIAWGEVHDEA